MATMIEEIYGDYTSRYPDVAVGTKKTRVIFRCKNKSCKHVWAKEYRKVYQVVGYTEWSKVTHKPYTVKDVYQYQRIEDGKVIRYEMDFNCPACGQRGESDIVVGTFSEHVCDARCMGVKKGACECSCGGANHGINYL